MKNIATDAVITAVRLQEQAVDPADPAEGYKIIYAKPDGLYAKGSTGLKFGPLGFPLVFGGRLQTDGGGNAITNGGNMLEFSLLDWDNGGFCPGAPPFTLFTVPEGYDGWYFCNFSAYIPIYGTQYGFSLLIAVLGKYVIARSNVDGGTGINGTPINMAGTVFLLEGDQVGVYATQSDEIEGHALMYPRFELFNLGKG